MEQKTFEEKCSEIRKNWDSVEDAMTVIRNPAALESCGFWNGVVWLSQSLKEKLHNSQELEQVFKELGLDKLERS